jgi:hypothetical protein
MTMQVGMVGIDGVLIASDTRMSDTPATAPAFGETLARPGDTRNRRKIIVDHKRGIVISCARTQKTAERVANAIREKLPDDDFAKPCAAIEEIGKEVLDTIKGDEFSDLLKDAQCLIAIRQPFPKLYVFQMTPEGTECENMEGTVAAGARVNSALFWKERYYERHQPIRSLIPLAAHLIVSASKLPGSIVGGLDIVLCERNAIRVLSEDSTWELEMQANRWDKHIGSLFSKYKVRLRFDPKIRG